jgi:hypothetical protein
MIGVVRRFLFEASFYIVMVAGIGYTLFTVGPWVETRFFPVVSKLEILSMVDNGDGTTTIETAFRKLRPCDYVGISWYHGDRATQFSRVPVILMRKEGDVSNPNRPLGYQRSGPWVIGVPIGDLETNSFAELQHTCHEWWTTTTEYFP